VISLAAVSPADQRVVDIPTRPHVTQRFLLLTPEKPRAAVILLAGGDGMIGIAPDGTIGRDSNFLVRTRGMFERHGYAVAVPDMTDSLSRVSKEHAEDLDAVVVAMQAIAGPSSSSEPVAAASAPRTSRLVTRCTASTRSS